MTFSESGLLHLRQHPLRPLARARLRMMLRDPDFAAALEAKVRRRMDLPAGNIDWSQIDWEKVLQIVLLILEAFL